MGKKTTKIAPFTWDFVTLPEEDRAMAIYDMRDACGSGGILADRETDTCAHHRWQYLPPLPQAK